MIKEICRRMSIEIYSFFRGRGLLWRCCWVAKIIRGSSQAVRVRRGDASGSEKKFNDRLHKLFGRYRSKGVRALISKLHSIVLIQIIRFFESHIVGRSIIVGMIIFSIGVGLGFVHNLSRRDWKLELVRLTLLRPHMRRILEG